MSEGFEICIDECGDQGFRFTGDQQSSEWFAVCGVILRKRVREAIQETITELKREVGCGLKRHLHFKKLKRFEHRKLVIERLSEKHGDHFRSVVVMIHKPSLTKPDSFREQNRLYFYATRFLLERASWYCSGQGGGHAKVVFSNLPAVSRNAVSEYFGRLKGMDTSIKWGIVDPAKFESLAPNKHPGLQLADCVGGAFYSAVTPAQKYRTTEWIETLKVTVYRSEEGKHWGYGLKMFPEEQIAQEQHCPWAKRIFQM